MLSLFKKMLGLSSSQALQDALRQNPILVDVRTPSEFNSGSAKGALNLPLNKLSNLLIKLDKSKTIIVFCASGMRSAQAKNLLLRNGFQNVINGGALSNILDAQNALQKK